MFPAEFGREEAGMGRCLRLVIICSMAASLIPLGGAATAIPPGAAAYDSIPTPLPGNVVSMAFEATSTSEFGDIIEFQSGPPLVLQSVDVVMSSWGCQAGHWYSGDCVTTPGATFSHPITLTIYEVDDSGSPPVTGDEVATKTQTFTIPYRPSADSSCTGGDAGKWRSSADGTCYNGIASTITFDFSLTTAALPDKVIFGIAFNTSHYGASSIGETPCNISSGGCPYDSLNVGAEATTPSVGTDLDEDGVFLNSSWPGAYCDGGTAGSFRLDHGPGCWTGFNPLVRFNVASSLAPCLVFDDQVTKRLTLLADCTTDHTLFIPDGYTFDGAGFTVHAVDPPPPGHFLGAVVQNGGTVMNVEDLTIDANHLADVCDAGAAALAGIRLDGASGSIHDNTIRVGQGPDGKSGCQEGDSIDVRNTAGVGTPSATIDANVTDAYIKTGVLVNGQVSAVVTDNTITGWGPVDVPFAAQNGIQISRGATAKIVGNEVSDNFYTPKSFVACGILIYKAGGVSGTKNGIASLRNDNILFNNEVDICNFGKGGSFKPA
jgi:hypothetical protein